MVRPTRRSLRSAIASLGCCFAIAGCQSVTQQKTAWSFTSFQDDIVDRASAAVENRALPPLPAGYENRAMPAGTSATPLAASPEDSIRNKATNGENLSLVDAAIVRTSTVSGQPGTKPFSGSESRVTASPEILVKPAAAINAASPTSATAGNAVLPGTQKNAVVPGPNQLMTKQAESFALVQMDPKTAGQIVKRIVGASDDLIRTGAEPDPEDDESISPLITSPFMHGDSRVLPGEAAKNSAERVRSAIPPGAAKVATRSSPARPPLETLPVETGEPGKYRTKTAPARPVLSIPKAVICKSVEGRGRFSAMSEQARVPGARIIVYWEMDGMPRDVTGQTGTFTALVELVSTQRDEILASARETVRESGPKPVEGDFAALRWSIPPELSAGDYRIRITVTEETTQQTATAQVDFSLGQAPIASRFVLP